MKTNKQVVLAAFLLSLTQIPNGFSQSFVHSGNFVPKKLAASGGHGGGNGGDGLELSSPLSLARRSGSTESANQCGSPNPDARGLFKLILDEGEDVSKIQAYLKNFVVSIDAVNDLCENALQFTLRLKKFNYFNEIYNSYSQVKLNEVNEKNNSSVMDFILTYGDFSLVKKFDSKWIVAKKFGSKLNQLLVFRPDLSIESITYLLGSSSKDSIYVKDINGRTALMIAAKNFKSEIVEVLVNAGSKVNERDQKGWTALMYAVQSGHDEVVERLISAGADLNTVSQDELTPLFLAIRGKKIELVESLLHSGANVNLKTKNKGFNALLFLTDSTLQSEDPESPLENSNKNEMIKTLVRYGINIDEVDDRTWTALYYILYTSKKVISDELKLSTIQVLVQAGANVNIASLSGFTPIIAAVASGSEVVHFLIQSGAFVNSKADFDQTALFMAALYGSSGVVEVLLNAGAEIGVRISHGSRNDYVYGASPLLGAVGYQFFSRGRADAISCDDLKRKVVLLIRSGAKVNDVVLNGSGYSALDYAIDPYPVDGEVYDGKLLCNGEIAKMLIKAGATQHQSKFEKIVKELSEHI